MRLPFHRRIERVQYQHSPRWRNSFRQDRTLLFFVLRHRNLPPHGAIMMFDTTPVRVNYATLATMNKVRAWARKNGATVKVSRYARDAYEGHVNVPSPWNMGREQTLALVRELKELLSSLHPGLN